MLKSILFETTEDSLSINFPTNDYLDQYRDLTLLCQEYAKEPQLKPFIKYTDMKNFQPIQVIDLRFRVYHVHPKNISCLKNTEVILIMLILMPGCLVF